MTVSTSFWVLIQTPGGAFSGQSVLRAFRNFSPEFSIADSITISVEKLQTCSTGSVCNATPHFLVPNSMCPGWLPCAVARARTSEVATCMHDKTPRGCRTCSQARRALAATSSSTPTTNRARLHAAAVAAAAVSSAGSHGRSRSYDSVSSTHPSRGTAAGECSTFPNWHAERQGFWGCWRWPDR